MKELSLILALLMSTQAFATERNPQPVANAQAKAAAVALSGSSADAAGGYVYNDEDHEKPAASSAIAPSVGSGNDCQIATPSSKAISLLIVSVSGTTGVTYNDLCYAYKRGQFDVSDKLMCLKSADYAKANPACSE